MRLTIPATQSKAHARPRSFPRVNSACTAFRRLAVTSSSRKAVRRPPGAGERVPAPSRRTPRRARFGKRVGIFNRQGDVFNRQGDVPIDAGIPRWHALFADSGERVRFVRVPVEHQGLPHRGGPRRSTDVGRALYVKYSTYIASPGDALSPTRSSAADSPTGDGAPATSRFNNPLQPGR